MGRPPGIEPGSPGPQPGILATELWPPSKQKWRIDVYKCYYIPVLLKVMCCPDGANDTAQSAADDSLEPIHGAKSSVLNER